MLDGKPRVDLNVLARDTRVLRQRNEHIRAVLKIGLEQRQQKNHYTLFPEIRQIA